MLVRTHYLVPPRARHAHLRTRRRKMEIYHEIWLDAHPRRTREWLEDKIKDGFVIHHIDGDHENNDPRNLLLCEGSDHMMLHGMPLGEMARRANVFNGRRSYRKKKRVRPRLSQWDYARLQSGLGPRT